MLIKGLGVKTSACVLYYVLVVLAVVQYFENVFECGLHTHTHEQNGVYVKDQQ